MKRLIVTALLCMAALGTAAGTASAGEWTCQNRAGNVVNGTCNGTALDIVNPGGNVPPGQNK